MVRFATYVLCLIGIVPASSQCADKPDAKKLLKVLGEVYWQERDSKLPRDKQVGPNGGTTWEFYPDISPPHARSTDLENEAQQWGGEIVINDKADPMWFDLRFTDNSRKRVLTGIIKLDGDRILWVQGKNIDAKTYDDAKGELEDRPKSFTTPKDEPLYLILERIKQK
jgi:hypothetical protein